MGSLFAWRSGARKVARRLTAFGGDPFWGSSLSSNSFRAKSPPSINDLSPPCSALVGDDLNPAPGAQGSRLNPMRETIP
jgi:hypothetical protein